MKVGDVLWRVIGGSVYRCRVVNVRDQTVIVFDGRSDTSRLLSELTAPNGWHESEADARRVELGYLVATMAAVEQDHARQVKAMQIKVDNLEEAIKTLDNRKTTRKP